jgi:hypothetical protein
VVHLRPRGDAQLRLLPEESSALSFSFNARRPRNHRRLSQPEFLLARARLESAAVECFAYDKNMLRIDGCHSHILGGIKQPVRESEAQDTLDILRHSAPLDNP